MAVTYQDYITALKANTRDYLVKLEFLDWNENVLSTLTPDLIDGNVNIELKNGSRRNASITLNNKDLRFLPDPLNEIWLNTKIRIYTGLLVNGEEYWNSQGIFVLGEPEINSNFAEKTVTLNLYDKFAMLDGTLAGELLYDFIIDVDTSLADAVKSIFVAAGEVKLPIIEPTSEILPFTIIINASQTYFDILDKLAETFSWSVYFDRNGFPRFETPSDINSDASIWNFEEDDILYMGGNKRLDFTKVKNKIRVVGNTSDLGEIYDAISEDTDANSPTRTSLIGERTKLIEDDIIYSTDLSQQRADWEKQQAISIYESTDMKCIPVDILDVDNVCSVFDTSLDLNGDRLLLQSINLPLRQTTSQSLKVWKIRSLS